MTKTPILFALLLMVAPWAACQPFADGAYVPPIESKAALAQMRVLPVEVLDEYLAQPGKVHAFSDFEGRNEALKAAESSDSKVLIGGKGMSVDLTSDVLFGEGVGQGGYTVFTATIASYDALAMRVLVDLSKLAAGDEVYVVDPVGPRAFGPYTAGDHVDGGKWLPTTEGEWCVLVGRTKSGDAPVVDVTGFSHFYRGLDEIMKELSCNINIACEDDAGLQQAASGVGILVVPQGTYDAGFCTCTLINNADTSAYEPYVLTSNHCVPGVRGASQVDVVWDYRATACGTNDPPSLSSLPRSDGDAMLATDEGLDITLIRVDSVPSGSFGRFYLGWTARNLTRGESVVGIHHPEATHMRISYGAIDELDIMIAGYYGQTQVLWSQGVTEKGSSGTALLLANESNRIVGTLSNGPTHVCGGTSNVDRFSSFSDFYSKVSGFLTGDNPPDPMSPGGLCAAEKAFEGSPETLENLRAFRNKALMSNGPGRRIAEGYYALSPYLVKMMAGSQSIRETFMTVAKPMAWVGKQMR